MYTQPEVSRMAKLLARELAKHGVKLKHTQAMELIAKVQGDRNLAVHQARSRKPQLNAGALAKEHALSMMFASTGRYGTNAEALFADIEAAFALEESRDVESAVWHIFGNAGAPKLHAHIEAMYRFDQLPGLFSQFSADALRLVDRTLFEARTLSASEPEVLFQGPMTDWRIQEGEDPEELGAKALRRFEGRLTRSGSQFYFDIALPHANPDDVTETDQLSLFIEINNGRPCVHVTSDLYGDQAVTIFGTERGTLLQFNTDNRNFHPSDEFSKEVGGNILLDQQD